MIFVAFEPFNSIIDVVGKKHFSKGAGELSLEDYGKSSLFVNPEILWEYQVWGLSAGDFRLHISPRGNFASLTNGTHLLFFNRDGLVWMKNYSTIPTISTTYVTDRGFCILISGINVSLFAPNGSLLGTYLAPSDSVITASAISPDGSFLVVAWDNGISQVLDFLNISQVSTIWHPYAEFIIPNSVNIMVDGIEISYDGERVLIYGYYIDYMIYVLSRFGQELWNVSTEFEYVDMGPDGDRIIWGDMYEIHVLNSTGDEILVINSNELHGGNPVDYFDRVTLTHRYIGVSVPSINILDLESEDPTLVVWSLAGSTTPVRDFISDYGDYFVTTENYQINFRKISTNELVWNLSIPNGGEVDRFLLSEYGTFILCLYHTLVQGENRYFIRLIASFPGVSISFDPHLVIDGRDYVSESTYFEISYSYIAPSAEVYYRIDGGSPRLYKNPFTLAYESDGIHTIYYWCRDYYGLVTEKSKIVYLDKTPPSLNIVSPENNSRVSRSFLLEVECYDSGVGVQKIEYRIDSGAWEEFNYSTNVSNLEVGKHVIYVKAVDKFGHETLSKIVIEVAEGTNVLFIAGVAIGIVVIVAIPIVLRIYKRK